VKVRQDEGNVAPRFNINVSNQLLNFAENSRHTVKCIAKSILKVVKVVNAKVTKVDLLSSLNYV